MKPESAPSNSLQSAQVGGHAHAVPSEASALSRTTPHNLRRWACRILGFASIWLLLAIPAGWFAYGCASCLNDAILGPKTVAVGGQVQLILEDSCGDTFPGATWSATPSGYLSIDSKGNVTGLSATPSGTTVAVTGSFPATASDRAHSATAQMTVTGPTLQTIAVTDANLPAGTAVVGGTDQFTATGTYSDSSTQNLTTFVNWTSAMPIVATIGVNTGLATGVSGGSSLITASFTINTAAPITGTETLNVSGSTPTLVSIAVTPSAPSVAAGLTQQFTATGTYSSGPTQNLTATATWGSTNTPVATIAAGGLATTLTQGTTLITATLGTIISPGVTLTASAPVLLSITVTPAGASIPVGQTQAYTADWALFRWKPSGDHHGRNLGLPQRDRNHQQQHWCRHRRRARKRDHYSYGCAITSATRNPHGDRRPTGNCSALSL